VIASLLRHPLHSHPAHPPPPGLRVEVQRLAPDDPSRPLRLRFELLGPVEVVRVPEPLRDGATPRTDGLWRQTCFEAFIAAPATPARLAAPDATPYVEFNVAPSGAWAIYRFDGYRDGMRPEPVPVEPRLRLSRAPGVLALEVALAWPAPLPGAGDDSGGSGAARTPGAAQASWRGRLGLTAVIEAADGTLSYWALHHPAARADFHNGGGFTLGLEVPP
jgi:hypothetical protein